jgi:aminoglycoside/choline kinase family phosphotransferase
MRLPEDALGSDEGQAAERPIELPFVDVQRLLAARGIPVPRIYVDDTKGRILLLEDLGDETFAQRLGKTRRERWPELYAQAVALLVRMHRACAEGEPHESIAFRRRFERSLLRWELDHFREWGLEALCGPLSNAEQSVLEASFEGLCDQIDGLPQGFVHRDYQSRNLMWANERLTVIDFQDAMRGPAVYDLCALLCDSYVALEQAEQEMLIERYAAGMGMDAPAGRRLQAAFWQVAAQRKLKDAGRFVFIDRVRGNPDFLRFYPQSLRYAGRALRMLGQHELIDLLAKRLSGFPDALTAPAAVSRPSP